jgi:uncharacterized membrane protein
MSCLFMWTCENYSTYLASYFNTYGKRKNFFRKQMALILWEIMIYNEHPFYIRNFHSGLFKFMEVVAYAGSALGHVSFNTRS